MLSEDRVAGFVHRVDRDRVGDMPRVPVEERVGGRCREDRVAIPPPLGAEPGVEVGVDEVDGAHRDRRAAHRIDGTLKSLRLESVGERVEGDDLAPGVHTFVGPAGTGDHDLVLEDPPQVRFQLPGDGRHAEVAGEAAEGGAVVRDEEPDPL